MPPDEISLPEIEDVEMDLPTASGSTGNDDDFRKKVAIAERALLEASGDRALARRARKDALQLLCRDRHLDDEGDKAELASRLINWVGLFPRQKN